MVRTVSSSVILRTSLPSEDLHFTLYRVFPITIRQSVPIQTFFFFFFFFFLVALGRNERARDRQRSGGGGGGGWGKGRGGEEEWRGVPYLSR